MDTISTNEQGINLEDEVNPRSLSGQELPEDWPQIANLEQEHSGYLVLYTEGEDPNIPPQSKTHIENLSYELVYGDKRLRFFAMKHPLEEQDINLQQFEILEQRFDESPPQLVLIEGQIDFDYPFIREEVLKYGEQAFMCYLVQQYNAGINEGEKPIVIESGDFKVNSESDNQVRDKYIVKNAAKKFEKYDKIDIVFGSGHAIRERNAWEQFFK